MKQMAMEVVRTTNLLCKGMTSLALLLSFALAAPSTQAATWTGNGGDSKFSNAENWENDVLPSTDPAAPAALVFNGQSGSLTNDLGGVAASSIQFSGCGAITLAGNVIAVYDNPADADDGYIESSSNSVNPVLDLPVDFRTANGDAGSGDLSLRSGNVRFAGGVTANKFGTQLGTIDGHVVLTSTTDETSADFTVLADSSITVDKLYLPSTKLVIEEGGSVTAAVARQEVKSVGGGFGNTTYLVKRNDGRFVVTDTLTIGDSAVVSSYATYDNTIAVSTGDFIINKLVALGRTHGTYYSTLYFEDRSPHCAQYVIGAGGICTTDCRVEFSSDALHCSGDYTISRDGDNVVFPLQTNLYLDTSDWSDPSVPRMVTVEGRISTNNSDPRTVYVKGNGMARFATPADGAKSDIDVNVGDTATFEIAEGCVATTGKLTMKGGTTLSVPETGIDQGGDFIVNNVSATSPIFVKIGTGLLPAGSYKVISATSIPSAEPDDYLKIGSPMVEGNVAKFRNEGGAIYCDVYPDGAYLWNGGTDGKAWSAENVWLTNMVETAWLDNNVAVFSTKDAEANLTANVAAEKVGFQRDAVVSGSATLTVPEVAVVSNVSATISAPTAGALEKSGEGTLTLGASRTEQTTVSEGTLAIANGATVDPSKLTLGTDAAKPVTFDYGEQSLTLDLSARSAIGTAAGGTATLANGEFTIPATLRVWNGSLTLAQGAHVALETSGNRWVCVGGNNAQSESATDVDARLVLDGGSIINNTGKHLGVGDFGTAPSKGEFVVKNGGSYWGKSNIIVAQGCEGHLVVDGDGSSVTASELYFCGETRDEAGENGYVVVANGGVLAVKSIKHGNGAGNGYFNFDGGTLKATANQTLLEKNECLFVNVNAAGGTIDNNGKNITINADLIGAGDITFVGSGKTTIGDVQTGTGALNVNEGTVEIVSGVTLSRAISVASGATLSVASLSAETPIATASTFAFASGSTLALPAITAKGKYKLFTLSSGTFAVDPLENATITGPLAPYAITAEGNTVYLNIEQDGYVFVGNEGIDSLTVTDNTILVGVGGAKLSSLSFGATSKLTFDPIRTPIKVSATPTFEEGAKIALSSDYAGMTLGKVVLMTYSGEATIPEGLFDVSSVSGTATLSQETAPDGTSKQLVLTVGDYENEAKEIRILPVGDSITQGIKCSSQNDYPQYRTTIAARLAANGYKPVMKGVWHMSQNDAAGVQQPDEWRWHSGISAERIMIGGTHGGVRDNMHVYLDMAGDVNAITILIGTNDIGSSDRTAEETYAAYTNLVFATAAQRPNAKIFGSTILDRDDKNDSVKERIAAFDTYLRTDYAAGRLPANYVMLDLYAALPVAESGNFFDKLHPNWKGDAVVGKAFANAIMAALPLTGEGAISGAPDPTVTDEVQTALGAANIPELADYRSGMTPIFTIDAAAKNGFTSAPYTTTNNILSLDSNVTKVGYYMELVRKGTNRRRYVWVDFDATGKTLGEVDFPWDGENLDFLAEKLHVYSNDPSIHNVAANDNSVTGVVEGTWHNYSAPDDNGDVPSDAKVDTYGWDDTLNTSGNGYGCFQVHRIFNEGEHWNRGEVLFAWNAWGGGKASSVDEIGIGSFAACSTEFVGTFSMDYTGTYNSGNGAKDTLNAEAYSVRRVEIWAVSDDSDLRHGVWVAGDGDFDDPDNWEDKQVPQAGDTLDFSGVTGNITINCNSDAAFGAVAMGSSVITFTGSFMATSFSDTSKIVVGENSTVTLDGDLVFSGSSDQYVVNTVAAGGRFVVTGRIEASSLMTGGQVFQYVNPGEGAVQAKGLVANEGTSDEWTFRLSSDKDGTANWIVGAEGLSGSKNFFAMYNSNRKAAIQPLDSNFTIATKVGIRAPLTFNTTGYDGNGHTITIAPAGVIGRDGALTISGAGKVLVDATNTLSSAVTVTNTATLAIKAGKQVTTGKTTIASGAVLELPDSASASVFLPGGLVFGNGEGHPVLSLGGLSANVTSLVVNATKLTYYSNKVAVRFATAPASGTYTILSAPNKDLNNDYAGYLMVEDAALAGKCTFSVSSDKHSVLLTVNGYTDDDGNGGFFNVLDTTLAKLPAGVTDPTVKPAGSVLSYAQADALGLLSDAGEITNELAVFSMTFNENNQPVISVCGAPNAAYAVTYSLLATADLASGLWTEVEGSSSATGIGLVDASDAAEMKFYKVKVVIGNK